MSNTAIFVPKLGTASADSTFSGSWLAQNLWDGIATSSWASTSTAFPHYFIIDFGAVYSISWLLLQPRISARQSCGDWQLYVSSDGVTWGTAITTGTFASDTANLKIITFTAVSTRYVKFVGVNAASGHEGTSTIMSVGEVWFGSGNPPLTTVDTQYFGGGSDDNAEWSPAWVYDYASPWQLGYSSAGKAWASTSSAFNHTFVVDMGDNQTFDSILYFGRPDASAAKAATVTVSTDGTTYGSAVWTGNLSQSSALLLLTSSQTARYIKFTVTSNWGATSPGFAVISQIMPMLQGAPFTSGSGGGGGGSSPVPQGSELKGGVVGATYSETLSAQGGTPSYTFAVTSGALPTGCSMSGGVISGTPSAAGTFTFTIAVTDSLSNTGNQSFTVAIAAPSSSGGGAYVFVA